MTRSLLLAGLLAVAAAGRAAAATHTVRTPDELRAAVRALADGDVLRIGPGEYPGGFHVEGRANLTIAALDPAAPPLFRGGSQAWHFSRCPGLTLRGLRVTGQRDNGLNLDDGGVLTNPVRGVVLDRIEVTDIGPQGNHDGIKCSGLDELTISNCVIAGWGGQGIDLVGCHAVRIAGCQLEGRAGFSASAGIQAKGGCSNVVIEGCRFMRAGARPLNIGGSTGLAYFRPPLDTAPAGTPRHEAAQIVVRGCVIEGGPCAAAFVGVDGALFEHNTIRHPEKWIFRILQETTAPGFVPCRNVVVRGNEIVFRRAEVAVEVNIGPGTAPETFRFERNRWRAEDDPTRSRPRLPVEERDGDYGGAARGREP